MAHLIQEEPTEQTALLDDRQSVQRGTIQRHTLERGKEGPRLDGNVQVDACTNKNRFGVVWIYVLEFFERLAYFGAIDNLVLYCTSILGMSSDDATTVNLVFTGAVYILTVVGGFVSDLYPGKFVTVSVSGLIYIMGLLLLTLTVNISHSWLQWPSPHAGHALFYVSLTLIGLGSGGIQANLGPFGAQQVEGQGDRAVQSFFNWFYWARNLGAVIANTFMVYLQQYTGFQWGYLALCISMVLENIASKSFIVCYKGCLKHRRLSSGSINSFYGEDIDDDLVNGVFGAIHVLPILSFFIIYWTVYTQMNTSYLLQSERMDMHLGGIQLPVAVPIVFNDLIILIFIPLMDCVLYRFFSSTKGRQTYFLRIGIGFVVATLSLIAAGCLEIFRRADIKWHGAINQTVVDLPLEASRLSMFVQIPQFALIGLSEIFAGISGFEFAYHQAPPFMQGLVTGLFCMTQGLGSFVQLLIVAISNAASNNDWFPDEPNNGHMEKLLFLMAGINTLNFIGFVVAARFYRTTHKVELQNIKATT